LRVADHVAPSQRGRVGLRVRTHDRADGEGGALHVAATLVRRIDSRADYVASLRGAASRRNEKADEEED
jgi:hypothetical protein